jgi:hypothetical protein
MYKGCTTYFSFVSCEESCRSTLQLRVPRNRVLQSLHLLGRPEGIHVRFIVVLDHVCGLMTGTDPVSTHMMPLSTLSTDESGTCPVLLFSVSGAQKTSNSCLFVTSRPQGRVQQPAGACWQEVKSPGSGDLCVPQQPSVP